MLNRTGSRIDPENSAFNLNTDYDSLIATLIKPIFHLDGRPTAQILTCHPAYKDSTGDLIKTPAKVKMDLLQGRKLLPLIHLCDLCPGKFTLAICRSPLFMHPEMAYNRIYSIIFPGRRVKLSNL